jgi:hypothetical protein
MRQFSACILALVLGWIVMPGSVHAGKKDLITQWKCSGPVDCGADVEPCVYKDEICGDKGGDVRRAVLRLIWACAERRGVDFAECRNGGIKCREIK